MMTQICGLVKYETSKTTLGIGGGAKFDVGMIEEADIGKLA